MSKNWASITRTRGILSFYDFWLWSYEQIDGQTDRRTAPLHNTALCNEDHIIYHMAILVKWSVYFRLIQLTQRPYVDVAYISAEAEQ